MVEEEEEGEEEERRLYARPPCKGRKDRLDLGRDSWRGHFLAIVGHLGNSLPGPFHRPLNGRVTYCKHFTAADNDRPEGASER